MPLGDLNPQQRKAASHDGGPLLIVAGAGTGKTTTLAHRVAWLVSQGIPPGRILLLTFTRRAAEQMLRRADHLVGRVSRGEGSSGGGSRERVWGGTFHAAAARLLRLHAREVGLPPGFTIMDRADAEDLVQVLRGEMGLGKERHRFPQKATCLDIYSRCVDAQESLAGVLDEHFPWCREHADDLKALFLAYMDRKHAQGVLDYDDLLLYWHALLQEPEVATRLRARFDQVLVDEYQDTNRLQAAILAGLCPQGKGLTVVGDDAQAIYSFRAATVRNILDFPASFPGTTVVTLEQNYRSTPSLVTATNAVMAQAAERHPKQLFSRRDTGALPEFVTCTDEEEQTDFVVASVLEQRETGVPLRRQAVLFRASHHSLGLEIELNRRNIPFRKYGGLRFLETAHIKDLLAFLRLAENPADVMAGTRVLLLLPGIGPKRAADLLSRVDRLSGFTRWRGDPPVTELATAWPFFVELLEEMAAPLPPPLPTQIHRVREFYAPLIERRHDDARARLQDLEQLEQIAATFPSRAQFLTEIVLDPPSWTGDLAGPPVLDEDWLVLSTMHSAKGLEWDTVYVIHAADGNIPSDLACGSQDQLEEERRLFYVALTRARDRLYVTAPFRYYTHPRSPRDTHGYAQPTRFLDEPARSCFLTRAARAATAADTPEDVPVTNGPAGDRVRAELRRLWA